MRSVVGGLVEDWSGFETRYFGGCFLCGLFWMYWLWLWLCNRMVLRCILNVALINIFMENLNDYEATICGGTLNMWSDINGVFRLYNDCDGNCLLQIV
jgi:hypothetical protein